MKNRKKPNEDLIIHKTDYVGQSLRNLMRVCGESKPPKDPTENIIIAFHVGCDHGKNAANHYLHGVISRFGPCKRISD